jgi:hypothetical protein
MPRKPSKVLEGRAPSAPKPPPKVRRKKPVKKVQVP